MADVLMNHQVDQEFNEIEDPFQPGLDVIEHLKLKYKEGFKARKLRERSYWPDPEEEFLARIRQSQ